MKACKYCGHDNFNGEDFNFSFGRNIIPERKFDLLNICQCPCHWTTEQKKRLIPIVHQIIAHDKKKQKQISKKLKNIKRLK